MKQTLLLFLIMSLTACSNLPTKLANAPVPDLSLKQLSSSDNIEQYTDQPIRWGGRIIKVENEESKTTIHILAFPLSNSARPSMTKESTGRFLIVSDQFLDPEIYKVDKMITVAGPIKAKKTIKVDRKTLHVPMIHLDEIYIWRSDQYPNTVYDQSLRNCNNRWYYRDGFYRHGYYHW